MANEPEPAPLVLDPLGTGRLADVVRTIASRVAAAGGRALVVGGAVRDALIAAESNAMVPSKDIDLEVFGVEPSTVLSIVEEHGEVMTTGTSFAVFKLAGLDLDVSIPRTESKTGEGHRAFLVNADPTLPPERAALRRDFTVNAISWDPLSGELVDPVGGVDDLQRRRLRHVSPAFAEDPLRVLRGAQFISRFDLDVAPTTRDLCRDLVGEGSTLPVERIADEWHKLLRGRRPGSALRFLHDCDWLQLFPELHALVERPNHHGSELDATADVMDAWATLRSESESPDDLLVIGLAATCARLDLDETTTLGDAPRRSLPEADGLLGRVTTRLAVRDDVITLLRHREQLTFDGTEPTTALIRRLAHQMGGQLDRLLRLERAIRSSGLGESDLVPLDTTATIASELGLLHTAPQALLTGQDLIDHGMTPGPHFGRILTQVFDAQLDEQVTTKSDALAHAMSLRDRS